MPRLPIDYSNTIIYKIVCKDIDIKECYVGHTTDFTNRKRTHKNYCNSTNSKHNNLPVYRFIKDNGGWDNWDMIEIEKIECSDLNEAKARERYWIETIHSTLNKVIPTQTKKEYYEVHKEEITKYNKEYLENNEEKLRKYYRQYNKEYAITHREDLKKYRKERRDERRIYEQKYYETKKNELIECECGSIIVKLGRYNHYKTSRHQKYCNEITKNKEMG